MINTWILVALTIAVVALGIFTVVRVEPARRAYLSMGRERGLAYGSVVTESGREFPISGLTLRDGALVFQFDIAGPLDGGAQSIRLVGADGASVVSVEGVDMPGRHRIDPMMHVTASVRFGGPAVSDLGVSRCATHLLA